MGTLILPTQVKYSTINISKKYKDKVILAINYKAYSTAFGTNALAITLAAERIAEEYNDTLIVIAAVPATEITRASEVADKLKIYA